MTQVSVPFYRPSSTPANGGGVGETSMMIAIVGAVMGLLIVGLGVVVLTVLGCAIWKKSKSGQYVLHDKEQRQESDLRRNSAYNG